MSDNTATECIEGSMLVRHLDGVNMANMFLKWEK